MGVPILLASKLERSPRGYAVRPCPRDRQVAIRQLRISEIDDIHPIIGVSRVDGVDFDQRHIGPQIVLASSSQK